MREEHENCLMRRHRAACSWNGVRVVAVSRPLIRWRNRVDVLDHSPAATSTRLDSDGRLRHRCDGDSTRTINQAGDVGSSSRVSVRRPDQSGTDMMQRTVNAVDFVCSSRISRLARRDLGMQCAGRYRRSGIELVWRPAGLASLKAELKWKMLERCCRFAGAERVSTRRGRRK